MLTITVTFLHGWLRAGAASDVRVTGQTDAGEWPPSPARLFSAFVAADGTRDRCQVTDGAELSLLEAASPPSILASPPERVARTALAGRFVVQDRTDTRGRSVQEYLARNATLVHPGTRLAPCDPTVVYRYDELDPSDEMLHALRLRAARIGYLGAADAPAHVTVSRQMPASSAPAWTPNDAGATVVAVPFPGLVDILDDAFDRFSDGQPLERSWLPQRHARYRSPSEPAPAPPAPETLWLRFDKPVAGHLALRVTETLRAAVLAHHPEGEQAPSVVHGHGMSGRAWEQVRYLPLVELGHAFAKGRIHGAAVWAPPTATAEERAGVRTSVLAVRRLTSQGVFDVEVNLHDGQSRRWAANPARWQGPASRWVSATPVVHERHGTPTDDEIGRWCAHAGLPEPVRWRTSRHPLATGAVDLRPSEVRRRYGRSPYSHLALEFAEPVTGPVAVGRGRQFGLGLLAPEQEHDDG